MKSVTRDLHALALAAIIARPWVDVVLSGAVDAKQLESNLQATTVSFLFTAVKDAQAAAGAGSFNHSQRSTAQ